MPPHTYGRVNAWESVPHPTPSERWCSVQEVHAPHHWHQEETVEYWYCLGSGRIEDVEQR